MKNDRDNSLISLRQQTARLAVAAIRNGASVTDVLIAVNHGLDSAGEVVHAEIEFVPTVRRDLRLRLVQ
jgi:hypothetical protein